MILDPGVVEAFAKNAEPLLAQAHAGDPRELLLEAEPEPVVEIDAERLAEVAAAFGDLADLKMPWTHGHSQRRRPAGHGRRTAAAPRQPDQLQARDLGAAP